MLDKFAYFIFVADMYPTMRRTTNLQNYFPAYWRKMCGRGPKPIQRQATVKITTDLTRTKENGWRASPAARPVRERTATHETQWQNFSIFEGQLTDRHFAGTKNDRQRSTIDGTPRFVALQRRAIGRRCGISFYQNRRNVCSKQLTALSIVMSICWLKATFKSIFAYWSFTYRCHIIEFDPKNSILVLWWVFFYF